MAADDVSLPDLEVIAQFSLAVRAATAPRAQVIAALEADLHALTGGPRSRPQPGRRGALAETARTPAGSLSAEAVPASASPAAGEAPTAASAPAEVPAETPAETPVETLAERPARTGRTAARTPVKARAKTPAKTPSAAPAEPAATAPAPSKRPAKAPAKAPKAPAQGRSVRTDLPDATPADTGA